MIRDAFIKLHISVLLAGTTGIFGRLIDLESAILVWYRMAIASLVLTGILIIKHAVPHIQTKEKVKILSVGCLLALHWIFFFGSIKASNVSIGVICFSLVSFFTALFEPLLNRHRLSAREIIYSLLTLTGILFIFGFDSRYRSGILLGTISSALAAIFTITNKKVSARHRSATLLFYEMIGGVLILTLLIPADLARHPALTLIPGADDLIYLFLLSTLCTLGPYFLQIQVLKKISAFTMNLTYNLEPVYSILFAMILFNENTELNYSFYAGLAIIVCSVVLQSVQVMKKRLPH